MSIVYNHIRKHLANLASSDLSLQNESTILRQINHQAAALSPADCFRFSLPELESISFRPTSDFPGQRIHAIIGCDNGLLLPKLEAAPNDDLFILAPDTAAAWLLLAESDPAAFCQPMPVHLFTQAKNFLNEIHKAQNNWRRIYLWLTPLAHNNHPGLCREITRHLELADAIATNLAETVNKHYFRWAANENHNLHRLLHSPHCLSSPADQPGLEIPAILIGAGPSLTQALPMLKKVSERDQALLIAASTTLRLLARENIRPHIAIIIEGRPQNHFDNLPIEYLQQIHLLVSLQTAPKHLDVPCRDISWFHHHSAPTRELVNQLHPTARPLVAGGSVINNAFALASAWGCKPIALCGCDLAYAGKQKYTNGLERKNSEEEKKDLTRRFFPVSGKEQTVLNAPPEFINYARDLEKQIISYFDKVPGSQIYNLSQGGRCLSKTIFMEPEKFFDTIPAPSKTISRELEAYINSWQTPPRTGQTILFDHHQKLKQLLNYLKTTSRRSVSCDITNIEKEILSQQLDQLSEFRNQAALNLIPWLFRLYNRAPQDSDYERLTACVKTLTMAVSNAP